MEDENETPNVRLPSSEHEQLIEERSDEMSLIAKFCEKSIPDTSGDATAEKVALEEDSSDLDLRSDENSPSNDINDIEATQNISDRDSAGNETQEKEFPNSSDLALQLPTTSIPESEIPERKLSEQETSENKSLEIKVTQAAGTSPEPLEIEVPQLSSPSPEPIDIDIPEQTEGSAELPKTIDQPHHEPQDHSGSDADNECSDEETPRALGEWQLRQLAENALEIALDASTPKPSSPSLSDPNICKPRTPLPERVWRPSTADPTEANKPKCPPCERKKKRFDCLGSPPCNECSKRNMTAEQCASYAPVRRRGKRRMQDDDGVVTQRGGKRGKRR